MMELKKFYGFLWTLILNIESAAFQIQKRATENRIEYMIHVYQTLNVGEDCSVGQKLIETKCKDSERAICLRNNTGKHLVAVCVGNITMQDLCPVFTTAKKNGRAPFRIIQMDHKSVCDNCSHYHLWDVGKYPQCLTLEINSAAITTNSSNSIPNFAGKGEQNYSNGLSGGGIAGIVIGVLVMIILLVILIVLHRVGFLQKLRERIRHTSVMIPLNQN